MLPTMTNRPANRRARARDRSSTDLSNWIDEFFNQTADSWTMWSPRADVYEVGDAYVLEMELAGFNREDVELTFENGVLTVSGRRREQEAEENATYYLRERATEEFSRSFALPRSVNYEEVEATLKEGLLRVHLPKLEEARPRRIEVKTS
jgi:HSP20 family protein